MARVRAVSARRRAALLALPLLAITLAGCGASGASTSTSVTATGTTLTVFLSDPTAVQSNPALQDVADAEQLAWTQHVTSVKNVSLKLTTLRQPSVSDNARKAIASPSILAYLGEIENGQSVQTVGITNAEDILELSPTDTVSPDKTDFEDYSSYGNTFGSLPINLTTSPAALKKALPSFAASFKTTFGHSPSADAIEGYDAVWILLRVLSALGGQANNRTKIASAVIATLRENQGQASVPAFSIKK